MKREPTALQVEINNLRAELKAKDARITELKAKLEPKTCDGCEYEGDKVGGFCYAFHTTCSREPTSDHFTPERENKMREIPQQST